MAINYVKPWIRDEITRKKITPWKCPTMSCCYIIAQLFPISKNKSKFPFSFFLIFSIILCAINISMVPAFVYIFYTNNDQIQENRRMISIISQYFHDAHRTPDKRYLINTVACINVFNSFSPGKSYIHQWTASSLVQVMACRLFGAKPLPEPLMNYLLVGSLGI